ncbi:MAG TPA: ribonuclease E/G, partial [Jiangellaceae bacterium]
MDDGNVTESTTTTNDPTSTATSTRRRRSASRAAGPPAAPEVTEAPSVVEGSQAEPGPTEPAAASTAAPRARRTRARASGNRREPAVQPAAADIPADSGDVEAPASDKPARRSRKKAAAATTRSRSGRASAADTGAEEPAGSPTDAGDAALISAETTPGVASSSSVPLLFQAPQFTAAETPARTAREQGRRARSDDDAEAEAADELHDEQDDADGTLRKRRRRGGRGRRKKGAGEASSTVDDESGQGGSGEDQAGADGAGADERPEREVTGDGTVEAGQEPDQGTGEDTAATRRRRRRRRRKGDADTDETQHDDPPNTVVRLREPRPADDTADEVTSVKGSTRLEAKKQRRRDGREVGRRRPPVISEAEFLARREAVDRVMVVRQTGDRIQIGVLEDDVLVEHYVSRSSQQSMVGNVYLGKVQNVLPAMEAAFVDIGRGRNAILYAGEVDWAGLGKPDGPRRIEEVLKSGQ